MFFFQPISLSCERQTGLILELQTLHFIVGNLTKIQTQRKQNDSDNLKKKNNKQTNKNKKIKTRENRQVSC